MLVSKILEGTLSSGATSISFTDSDIPNSFIRIGSTDPDLMPTTMSVSGTTLTISYEAQSSAKGIVVNLVKAGVSVIDALNSNDSDNALSAKQGKALNDALSNLTETVNNLDIPENITDLDDVVLTSPTEGQVLSIDSDGKIVNTNPTGVSDIIYSSSEQKIGKWLNNEDLYQITAYIPALPNNAWTTYSFPITNANMVYIYDGFVIASNGDTFPLQLTNDSLAGQWAIRYQVTQSRFSMWAGSDRSTFSAYVTLRYTKTS